MSTTREQKPYARPCRAGKVNVSAYLHPDFKRSVHQVQAETGESIDKVFARALNNLFRQHGAPVVDPVTGAEQHDNQETNTAA